MYKKIQDNIIFLIFFLHFRRPNKRRPIPRLTAMKTMLTIIFVKTATTVKTKIVMKTSTTISTKIIMKTSTKMLMMLFVKTSSKRLMIFM